MQMTIEKKSGVKVELTKYGYHITLPLGDYTVTTPGAPIEVMRDLYEQLGRALDGPIECKGTCNCPDCLTEACCYRQRKGFSDHSDTCRKSKS